jgi:hypothetical protein
VQHLDIADQRFNIFSSFIPTALFIRPQIEQTTIQPHPYPHTQWQPLSPHRTAAMSGEGPDSIPTSADPRSKRPTKKRGLTPVSEQAKSLDALFAKPDQDIRIPDSSTSTDALARQRHAPPEIVTNVQGSSAGAGSGEFHVYKASRRREYERLRVMDDEVKKEKAAAEFESNKRERIARDEERTRKNREKREKLKARKAKKGNAAAIAGEGAGGGTGETAPKTSGLKANSSASMRRFPRDGRPSHRWSGARRAGHSRRGLRRLSFLRIVTTRDKTCITPEDSGIPGLNRFV